MRFAILTVVWAIAVIAWAHAIGYVLELVLTLRLLVT